MEERSKELFSGLRRWRSTRFVGAYAFTIDQGLASRYGPSSRLEHYSDAYGVPRVRGVALALSSASATTYQLTCTGQKLLKVARERPIHGAKHFSFVVQSSIPFPKNTCFGVPPAEVTTFTDGIDALPSLAAAGYVFQSASVFSICTYETDRKLASWNIGYTFTKQNGHLQDYYNTGSVFPAQAPNLVEDLVYFTYGRRGGATSRANQNSDDPGRWKYQVSGQ